MRLLHIDSSILGDASVSRQLTAAAVARQRRLHPGLTVERLDLAVTPLPHLTAEGLPLLGRAVDGIDPLAQFLAADIVVIGAPMYNFGIPSQLKAWIDRIMVAGKTFAYEATGPRGLAGDKRVIVAISRGGFYGPESPAAAAEHVESYLKAAFAFIGVTDLSFVVAEGVKVSPEARETAVSGALKRLAA